ncbi:short-chain dehydrogenase [Streptomyces hainanensis]|uniref:Short-chain dehydrogenase n=1 Tax=Streptomyces hainanensis TaxID=402648 RepID=A0A4R4TCZ6_9ACTN|nr:short-chain dehydrogenase [Streptomyces hainanensis]
MNVTTNPEPLLAGKVALVTGAGRGIGVVLPVDGGMAA